MSRTGLLMRKIASVDLLNGEQEVIVPYAELKRRDVRALIFYLLYIADTMDYTMPIQEVASDFELGFGIIIPPHSEVVATTQSIILVREHLDHVYSTLLKNWDFDRISLCAKIILRFGAWELKYSRTDPRIVINEAVELAKSFAEADAYKFINGILDGVAKTIQSGEKRK